MKLLVIAPMLALGAFHFLVTTPLIKRAVNKSDGSIKLVNLFHGLLTGKMVLGLMVLILLGILTTLPPARAVATSAGYTQTTMVNDQKVSMNIDPGHAGMNTLTAMITSNGKPVTGARDVSLEFNPLSGMMAARKAAMTDKGNGVYSLRGGYLAMADQWDVKVVVRRTGQFDAYAGFSVPISQAISTTISRQPIITGLLVAVLFYLVFLSLWLPGILPKRGAGSEI